MVKRRIEYSPHYTVPENEKTPKFGEPLPKRTSGRKQRRPLAEGSSPGIWQGTDSATVEGFAPDVKKTETGNRDWEEYVLERGTGVEQRIRGRSYTIGVKHPLIDIWTSPPETWGAKRIGAINNCRIIVLKQDKPKDSDSSSTIPAGWTQIVVIEGTSARQNVLRAREFNNELGTQTFVSAKWSQIRAKPRQS